MTTNNGNISANSGRIAKNTILLYFRMLLMLFIGLFTSRVILQALGVNDYGVYNVVGGVVAVFTFVTNSISNSIVRFLTYEIGRGDADKLRKVFFTSVIIQMMIALVVALLVETVGMWLLHNKLDVPEGSMDVASVVLHCSLGVLMVNLLAVPFNASIIAHEKMGAYAAISILEALLKLSVALLLFLSPYNKLKSYAVLMLIVAVIVRLVYGTYCRRHFPESRVGLKWDSDMVGEISGFALWSFFGSGAYVLNMQGISIVLNIFFGVVVNAARGIATQVEGIVKQFVTNMLTAFNPQITKSWASGDKDYCFVLVTKASKYVYLIILTIMLPLSLESEILLRLWLGQVPEYATLFVTLTFCTLLELVANPLHTLQLATGRVRNYFLLTASVSYLVLPLLCLAFRFGAPPQWAYYSFFSVYLLVGVLRVFYVHRQTGFPLAPYLSMMLRLALVTCCTLPLPLAIRIFMSQGLLRLLVVCLLSWSAAALSVWMLALSRGEKDYVRSKVKLIRKNFCGGESLRAKLFDYKD